MQARWLRLTVRDSRTPTTRTQKLSRRLLRNDRCPCGPSRRAAVTSLFIRTPIRSQTNRKFYAPASLLPENVVYRGTAVEIGGKHLDSPGYALLGLVCGSEGQLGVVTEATVRILRAAEGARPVLMGFDSSEQAGAAVAAIIGAGIVPVAMEFMDKPAIEICEAFAHAGY